MPTDNENSMTNVELAEKFWQQLLTAPAISESDRAVIEAHCEKLMLSFTRSSFLAETLIQNPSFVSRIVEPYQPPEKSETLQSLGNTMSSSYLASLNNELHTVASEDDLLQVLREFRNKEMARITFLDVLNKQPIEISLMQVSALADVLINGAYHWLYQHLAVRYGKPQSHNQDMHMYILGMGKLGGKELNFSSDIDLIFTYPEKGETQGGRKSVEHQQFFTKLAQKLIQALNKVTNDGQVYRVDMRLRPLRRFWPPCDAFRGT